VDGRGPGALRWAGEASIGSSQFSIRSVQPPRKLTLGRDHWRAMRAHVVAALPYEACGLLAGAAGEVREVYPIPNQLRSRVRYRMEPSEQVRAFTIIESNDMELVAIYHSHTAAPGTADEAMAQPSATDIAEAAYAVVQVLWSRIRGPWEANGYWISGERVAQVLLEIRDVG
jgi:proteasome lid subunit RPN8/RPN11